MKVKVVNKSNHRLPEYAHIGDAGMDIKANISEPIIIKPRERQLIPTGLHTLLPDGYELQIRPRSGLALKYGLTCANAVGTVDKNFTGEIGVILINLGEHNFVVNPGDRIAQAVLNKVEKIEWDEVSTLDNTDRGENGFGSTGI